ncbi:MAG: acyltransferase family protein [Cytophaga sp.]|uniref:acyltransferase family protein n=1 Tax=Cytophaga sp. TaxID=29535 RepID=UPI003F7FDDC7
MSSSQNKIYFDYLQSFRGFAVINVILRHAIILFYFGSLNVDINPDSAISMFNMLALRGVTMYFTILSGILFSAVFKNRGYIKFYRDKFFYLVIPYIFFSIWLTLFKNISFEPFHIDLKGFYSMLPLDLLCGKSEYALWYIPVFIIICTLTPLLDFLLHKNSFTRCIFFLFVLAPLFIARAKFVDTTYIRVETVIYFTGSYAIGMYCGLDLEKTMQVIEKRLVFIIGVVVLVTAGLFYKISMPGFINVTESFFYVQKVALAFLVMLFFKMLGEKQPDWLRFVAKDSMLTYFMHGVVLTTTGSLFYFLYEYENIYPLNIIVAIIILTITTLLICKGIIYLLRKLLGSRAKMFLGSA